MKAKPEIVPVMRWVITHLNKDGDRVIATAAQGRNTFETREECEEFKDAILSNNSKETLREIYGFPLESRETPCYPGHFDPMQIWFDVEV